MTSAPRSARIIVSRVPAIAAVRSTTLMPFNKSMNFTYLSLTYHQSGQPEDYPGEKDTESNHHKHDGDEGIYTFDNVPVCYAQLWCRRTSQIKYRGSERRAQETGLQVNNHHHGKPERIKLQGNNGGG